jgi:polyferredoxin
VDVLRDRNALYRRLDDGRIENVYTVRFINKDTQAHALRVYAEGIDRLSVDTDREVQSVGAGEVVSAAVRIRAPAGAVSGGRTIQIVVESDDGEIQARSDARFIAPVSR